MLAIGLMSGTSLDGIDAALCEVSGSGLETEIKLLAFDTYELPERIKASVRRCAANELITPAGLSTLNFELGDLFAQAVLQLCKKAEISLDQLDFIASHGQTIYHNPTPSDGSVPSTLQLGESAVIAAKCETTVVSDFRVIDLAVGGQGAPLVPYSEYILYSDPNKNRALQNIGGIGNITVVPKSQKIQDIFAFDTGPGNMMIDSAMQDLYGVSYDSNGEIGLKGQVIPELQDILKVHPYLSQPIPKSTGREVFGDVYVKEILQTFKSRSQAEDIIATLSWYTAYCIAYHYEKYIQPLYPIDDLIIGGGGSHNKAVIAYLSDLLPDIDVLVQEDLGFSSDAKEAVAFVILANETLRNNISNVPSATGAGKEVVLGKIQYPPK